MEQVIHEENNVLQVDLSKPADEDIADDRPVSVRDALVFLELANFETEHSVPGVSGIPFTLQRVVLTVILLKFWTPLTFALISISRNSADSRRASLQLLAKEWGLNTGKLPLGGLPWNSVVK